MPGAGTPGAVREVGVNTISRMLAVGLAVLSGSGAFPFAAAEPVTADQLVARCAAAMGGAERIAAIGTLRVAVEYPGKKGPCTVEIKRPNHIRSEADYILVFNGKRAGYLKGAPSTEGRDPGPKLLPAEEGKDFEVDIAFLFPAFFDYPAEYLGLETIGGEEFHKLGVVLPMGIRMVYLLDVHTFLPRTIVAEIPYQGSIYRPEHTVGDYERTDGVLFPRTSTATGWGPAGRARITSVEVSVPLADDRFEMPDASGARHPRRRFSRARCPSRWTTTA